MASASFGSPNGISGRCFNWNAKNHNQIPPSARITPISHHVGKALDVNSGRVNQYKSRQRIAIIHIAIFGSSDLLRFKSRESSAKNGIKKCSTSTITATTPHEPFSRDL